MHSLLQAAHALGVLLSTVLWFFSLVGVFVSFVCRLSSYDSQGKRIKTPQSVRRVGSSIFFLIATLLFLWADIALIKAYL